MVYKTRIFKQNMKDRKQLIYSKIKIRDKDINDHFGICLTKEELKWLHLNYFPIAGCWQTGSKDSFLKLLVWLGVPNKRTSDLDSLSWRKFEASSILYHPDRSRYVKAPFCCFQRGGHIIVYRRHKEINIVLMDNLT